MPLSIAAEGIPWKEVPFSKTTFEEDIKVVLKELLKRNGLDVVFRPGVEGIVTFAFENMPLQAAFNKLMEENGLDFSYKSADHSVTIFPSRSANLGRAIVIPKSATVDELLSTLHKLKAMDSSVTTSQDPGIGAIVLQGPDDKVNNISKLMATLDEAYGARQQKVLSERQRMLEDRQRELDLTGRQRELEKTSMEVARAQSVVLVKVIPLRFASVDTSETTFQGKKVSLPGIIDSLRAFVGASSLEVTGEEGKGGAAKAGSSNHPWSNSDSNSNEGSRRSTSSLDVGNNRPLVSVDRRTNAVVVQGTAEQIKRIEDVLKELDKPVPLVEIEVMIVNGSANFTRQLGIRWGSAQTVGQNASNLELPGNVVSSGTVAALSLTPKTTVPASTSIISSTTGTALATNTAATTANISNSGMFQLSSLGSTMGMGFLFRGSRGVLDATLSALSQENKIQTIASPRVVTLNNLPAKITNSTNLNFVVTTGDGTRSNIEKVSSGLSLQITPSVIPEKDGSNRLLRLDISARNSTPGSSTASTVTTTDQEVQTNVIMPASSTFIMGGLFNNARREAEGGIPGLKDIPILGALFRDQSSDDIKDETVFFITPRIYTYDEIATKQGEELRSYLDRQRHFLREGTTQMQQNSQLLNVTHPVDEDE
ncbi:MAG: hypothetical protein H7833_06175 [Magnetococcus sp. DMHC-1]